MAKTPEEEKKAQEELNAEKDKTIEKLREQLRLQEKVVDSQEKQILGAQKLAEIEQNNIRANADYYNSQVRLAEHFGNAAAARQARSEQYLQILKQQELAMKKGSEVEASILAGLREQEKERYASDAEFKKQKIKEVLAAEAGISDEKLKILEY